MKNIIFSLALVASVFSTVAHADDYTTSRLRGHTLTLLKPVAAVRPDILIPSASYLEGASDLAERRKVELQILNDIKTGDVYAGSVEEQPVTLHAGQTFTIENEVWNPFMHQMTLNFVDGYRKHYAITVSSATTKALQAPERNEGGALSLDAITNTITVQEFEKTNPEAATLYPFGAIR